MKKKPFSPSVWPQVETHQARTVRTAWSTGALPGSAPNQKPGDDEPSLEQEARAGRATMSFGRRKHGDKARLQSGESARVSGCRVGGDAGPPDHGDKTGEDGGGSEPRFSSLVCVCAPERIPACRPPFPLYAYRLWGESGTWKR